MVETSSRAKEVDNEPVGNNHGLVLECMYPPMAVIDSFLVHKRLANGPNRSVNEANTIWHIQLRCLRNSSAEDFQVGQLKSILINLVEVGLLMMYQTQYMVLDP